MPPVMTSQRGPSRPSSTSGISGGTLPRREPLRRLYPLQRTSRAQSDSIKEYNGILNSGNENKTPKTVLLIDADAVLKQRGIRLHNGSITPQLLMSSNSKPEKVMYRYDSPDRYLDRTGEKIVYTRPNLIRRSSDIGTSSSSSHCPVHGNSRSRSILKRPSSVRSKSRDLIINNQHKQVQFCPNVSVVKMDEDGEHLSTHMAELNGEKRKRLGTLTRNSHRDYDNVVYFNENTEPVINSEKMSNYENFKAFTEPKSSGHDRRSLKDKRDGEVEENMTLKKGQFNITFTSRSGGLGTRMRFVLNMGPEYHPHDLVVKANTTGSRIRIIATPGAQSSSVGEEYNERFQLPMDIDPYEIEARLDKHGVLTVEAPLVTSEKQNRLSKGSQAMYV